MATPPTLRALKNVKRTRYTLMREYHLNPQEARNLPLSEAQFMIYCLREEAPDGDRGQGGGTLQDRIRGTWARREARGEAQLQDALENGEPLGRN